MGGAVPTRPPEPTSVHEQRTNVFPHVRTDAGARVLVSRIDGLAARMEDFVTKAKLYLTIGFAGLSVVGVCYGLVEKNERHLAEHEAEHRTEIGGIRQDIQTVRVEQQAAVNRQDTKMDKLSAIIIDRLPAPVRRVRYVPEGPGAPSGGSQ